jgi:hypoxanthine phosphoribosyltransferase
MESDRAIEHPVPQPRVLISRERLQQRVSELAREIERDYRSLDPIAVGVLKGSVFFLVDLLQQVDLPMAVDFFQTASYTGTHRGEVRVVKDIDLPIRGRDVLLIEDIVDTGYTLRTILDLLRFRGAASVRLCALLDKKEAREVDVTVDYCGFEIENLFVVGYGLDYEEVYRNLPYIGALPSNTDDETDDETHDEEEANP